MTFLVFLLPAALLALAVLAAFAAGIVGAAWRFGLVRTKRNFRLLAALGMMAPPAIWQQFDRLRTAQCHAVNGPDELSCGGELGGVFVSLLQFCLILGGLIVGLWLGGILHRRWAPRAR